MAKNITDKYIIEKYQQLCYIIYANIVFRANPKLRNNLACIKILFPSCYRRVYCSAKKREHSFFFPMVHWLTIEEFNVYQ